MNPTIACIGCGQALPDNYQFAAVPQGLRIILDPARGRVWRGCTACGYWNLLGEESARIALPELEARFQAAPKTPGVTDGPVAHVAPGVELIRLGMTATPQLNDVAALRRRRQIERNTVVMQALAGLFLLYFLYIVLDTATHIDQFLENLPGSLVMCSSVLLIKAGLDYRVGERPPRRYLVLSLGAFIVGWILVGLQSPGWLAALPVVGVVVAIAAARLAPTWSIDVTLPSGKPLQLAPTSLNAVTFSWDSETSALSVHDLPGAGELVGPDALMALRSVLGHERYATRMETEAAWDLVRSVGGLGGLLRALEEFGRDQNGRLGVRQLPDVYALALDLALAQLEHPDADVTDLRDVAQHAGQLADLAEELERISPGPANKANGAT